MADTGSEIIPASGNSPELPGARRAHTYSRLTTAMAVLALATVHLCAAAHRLDARQARSHQRRRALARRGSRPAARRIKSQASRERAGAPRSGPSPRRAGRRAAAVEELLCRSKSCAAAPKGPERAWSRAEAMFLLELAQRRLTLDRDVETAIVALESADTAPGLAARSERRAGAAADRARAASTARRAPARHHRHPGTAGQRRRATTRRADERHPGHRAQRVRSHELAGRNVRSCVRNGRAARLRISSSCAKSTIWPAVS